MIQFKLLTQDAKAPKRATEHSAGFDIYAPERVDIPAGQSYLVGTGVAMAIPSGWVGIVNPRSSVAHKKDVRLKARVIDSDYRGEVFISLKNDSNETFEIVKGDRIAQLVVTPFMGESIVVDDLDDTVRGSGSFGSTGR